MMLCAVAAAALVLGARYLDREPPKPPPPKPVPATGPGFETMLPAGFKNMDVQETRMFTDAGAATVRVSAANSHPLILEIHTITPDDARAAAAMLHAVRNADTSDFLPGLHRAEATLTVETRAPRSGTDDADRTPLDELAHMLTTRDAALVVRAIMGAALPPEVADSLPAHISVRADEAAGKIVLTVSGRDPDLCAAIADAYTRFLQDRSSRALDHVLEFLGQRLERLDKDIAWYDTNIADYQRQLGLRDPHADPTDEDLLIQALETDRASAEADLVTVHAQLFEARRLAPGAPDTTAEEFLEQYSNRTLQPPPRTVESKSGAEQKLSPREEANERLRALELERRALGSGDKTADRTAQLDRGIAAAQRELEDLIRGEIEEKEQETDAGENGAEDGKKQEPGDVQDIPAELAEKLRALELSLALEKAYFDRLDISTKLLKKNRGQADGLSGELVRMIREREALIAVRAHLSDRGRDAQRIAAQSPLSVKPQGRPVSSRTPVLPRGDLPALAAHLMGGMIIDKKETIKLGGRDAVAIRATMPWESGSTVHTHQAVIAASGRIYWLRAIALNKSALDSPEVTRFFTEFKITR